MRRFDACTLCLQRARDPVACQKGHLFCRECVLTDLGAFCLFLPSNQSGYMRSGNPFGLRRECRTDKTGILAVQWRRSVTSRDRRFA